MKVLRTHISDVLIFEPLILDDERGFIYECYNRKVLKDILGLDPNPVQDFHYYSAKNVLRGLNYYLQHSQGSLIRVISGEIYQVILDLRRNSKTLGQWIGLKLRANDKRVIWVPKGFAHGFLVVTDSAEVEEKSCGEFDPQQQKSIRWNDPDLAIPWPVQGVPILSKKDREGFLFNDAELCQ